MSDNVLHDAFVWLNDPLNWQGPDGILTLTAQHLGMTAAAVGIAAVIALPLGTWLGHVRRFDRFSAGLLVAANTSRALPTLGVILLLATAGLFGNTATVIAAALFAIPVILTNTYTGVRGVDAGVTDAARGVGMGGTRIVWQVELPLAVPLVAAGLRTTIVQVVATIPLAALAGGGGLGQIINLGFGTQNYGQVLAGGLLIAVLCLVIDGILAVLQRVVTPRPLRVSGRPRTA
ncbi:ABC transporter permease [Luteimicrobium subarcticum]|uniref:Osmoprotectant transport system permease protein n=1 Tax=Luteimicrobium subarcticum TaxID=620910 RepID=A0A2M8WVQ1_9MICO|nr:ABC transporter permease subunit [Luteimicrobium subarcticum]PJI95004.1 osmoprotectant transport system permease protein [Luteimicrobium subarcticum]